MLTPESLCSRVGVFGRSVSLSKVTEVEKMVVLAAHYKPSRLRAPLQLLIHQQVFHRIFIIQDDMKLVEGRLMTALPVPAARNSLAAAEGPSSGGHLSAHVCGEVGQVLTKASRLLLLLK